MLISCAVGVVNEWDTTCCSEVISHFLLCAGVYLELSEFHEYCSRCDGG